MNILRNFYAVVWKTERKDIKLRDVSVIFRKFIIFSIKLYRNCISPLKLPSCRFYPTCSQYAMDAVAKYGSFKGSMMALKRIFKCHPFNPGGYDPVK